MVGRLIHSKSRLRLEFGVWVMVGLRSEKSVLVVNKHRQGWGPNYFRALVKDNYMCPFFPSPPTAP